MTRSSTLGAAALAAALAACTSGGGSDTRNAKAIDQSDYKIVAWNDLGMHCLNPTYDDLVILPPYNTIWAQVIRRGDPPVLVTSGVTVEYRLVGNTFSSGKASFAQFWQNAPALFNGATPAVDHGLNLVDKGISNGLAGAMVAKKDHFEVDGAPVVPYGDDRAWNPYQVAEITVKDANGAVLARTQTTVPTSDELDCAKCHGATPFADIRAKHEAEQGFTLPRPGLCAGCHASPALGIMTNAGGATTWLSQAVHGFHGRLAPDQQPACYDCHPGQRTQCSRSLAHTAADGNCQHCHGALPEVAASIASGRVPWVSEPACVTCHAGVPEVDTGATLYRHATGHGGVYCAGCHASPHAMIPSRVASDQAQAVQYQGAPLPLSDCNVCHDTSRGGGLSEFDEAHAGPSPEAANACRMCHTVVPGTSQLSRWPHGFGWQTRTIAY